MPLDLLDLIIGDGSHNFDPVTTTDPFGPALAAATASSRRSCFLPDGAGGDAVAAWFFGRARADARFALYYDFVESGRGYQDWACSFQSADADNHPWIRIADKFPMLLSRIGRLYLTISSSMRELTERLAHDRGNISRKFGIDPRARVLDLLVPLSDPHCGGRSVVRLRFDDGRSLIYKPKPLAIEAHINAFLQRHGKLFGLRSLGVLDRGAYGYVEDAGPARRLDRAEPRDGEAMGRAAAFFWLLNATDLHAENILPGSAIACLDLETLFSPPSIIANGEEFSWRDHLVTTTLLFDASAFAHSRLANISGFHPRASDGRFAPDVRFTVEGDQLLLQSVPAAIDQHPNESIAKDDVDDRLLTAITRGFREACSPEARGLLGTLVEGLNDDTPLRFVARETFFYGRIVERLRQPRFMRATSAFIADLQTLHESVTADGESGGRLHLLVDDEIRQLADGDIPYFSYRLGGRTIALSDGTLLDAFAQTPKSLAIEKLVNVECSDVEEQIGLIQIALGFGPPRSSPAPLSKGLADDLRTLARGLIRTAYRPLNDRTRWLTLRGDVSKTDLRVGVGGRTLFSGSTGIILALQAAEVALGDAEISDFLDSEATRWSAMIAPRLDSDLPICLGFSGIGGDLLASTELVRLAAGRWQFLLEHARERVRHAVAAIPKDTWPDVMVGTAGLALALLRLRELPLDAYLRSTVDEALVASARHILRSAIRYESGQAWPMPFAPVPLLGYAHGWAGIVAALAGIRAALLEGEVTASIDVCLRDSLSYVAADIERSGGLVEHRAGMEQGAPLNGSWCNGAPGFLRGFYSLPEPRDQLVSSHAESLYGKMVRELGNSGSHRFCCGVMGAVDATLDLSKLRGDRNSYRLAVQAGHGVVARTVRDAGASRGSLRPETAFPGLYQGLGGILYTGCRLTSVDIRSLSGQGSPIGTMQPRE